MHLEGNFFSSFHPAKPSVHLEDKHDLCPLRKNIGLSAITHHNSVIPKRSNIADNWS